ARPAGARRGGAVVVRPRHVPSDLVDARCRLAQLAESTLDLANDLRRVVEPRAEGHLGALGDLAALAQPLVHLGGERRDLLSQELTLLAERLAELTPERIELLLHHEDRATGAPFPARPPRAPHQPA